MPPMPASAQRRGPTWIDKLKMGMLMGGTVGGIMGFIYGTVTVFQYGAGQAGVTRTLGKYMLGSGATFRHWRKARIVQGRHRGVADLICKKPQLSQVRRQAMSLFFIPSAATTEVAWNPIDHRDFDSSPLTAYEDQPV
ncbi:hypothetical protein A1O3_03110 [Capronia epimyces CBS 606.96]|uniref:Mitochondrial genome maintenance protein Mgr2 n=1 Tax=Capronia epimyces CBS 606.96 TaxID=1182542 RepID=W9YB08_9EURO|nr:uncharacterized protein A1O3_03110 [Capronia epimyces CBS 606.96]EXJ90042.1 hypothetical protein A1O3_03110 [Capronia epimyces CBS 606.96]